MTSQISVRQERRENMERVAESTISQMGWPDPCDSPTSKSHTSERRLGLQKSFGPKEYQISFLNEHTQLKAFSEGGRGNIGNLVFDPKSFKHKFKRMHFDTPQGQIDTNIDLFS